MAITAYNVGELVYLKWNESRVFEITGLQYDAAGVWNGKYYVDPQDTHQADSVFESDIWKKVPFENTYFDTTVGINPVFSPETGSGGQSGIINLTPSFDVGIPTDGGFGGWNQQHQTTGYDDISVPNQLSFSNLGNILPFIIIAAIGFMLLRR